MTVNEPIGGDSFWFGSVEYSIPIVEKEGGVGVRVATFYDVGIGRRRHHHFFRKF